MILDARFKTILLKAWDTVHAAEANKVTVSILKVVLQKKMTGEKAIAMGNNAFVNW